MAYKIDDLPFEEFFVPVHKATAALVRLDERLSRSPIREGMVERMHMHDAVASMWLEAELVHMEDLVLHDALMDSRMPSHALTIAHAVLRMRRQIAGRSADWALGPIGIQQLLGRTVDTTPPEIEPSEGTDDEVNPLFDDIDNLLARTDALLKGGVPGKSKPETTARDTLLYDDDWDGLSCWDKASAATYARRIDPRRMVFSGGCTAIVMDWPIADCRLLASKWSCNGASAGD